MKVILSPLAEAKLKLLLAYLDFEWGDLSKKNFLEKFDASVNQITTFPESGSRSNRYGGIYRLVVTEQTSVYYRIKKERIEIITVTDNRQDPEEVAKELGKFIDDS